MMNHPDNVVYPILQYPDHSLVTAYEQYSIGIFLIF